MFYSLSYLKYLSVSIEYYNLLNISIDSQCAHRGCKLLYFSHTELKYEPWLKCDSAGRGEWHDVRSVSESYSCLVPCLCC